MTSLPSRERGLKSTPAPTCAAIYLSLPSRERGLKYEEINALKRQNEVAPLAGAWIEIILRHRAWKMGIRRSPRGSVD